MTYSTDSTGCRNPLASQKATNDRSSPTHFGEESLSTHVERAVRQYFKILEGAEPTNLFEIMLQQLEKPLLSVVLEQTRGNQSKTAEILGLNRGTLRKKLKTHHLL